MRDYGRVAPTFWTGSTGRKLRGKPVLQVVAMYLFTAPNSNMIGLYYLPLPIVAHETGLTLDQVTAALAELAALDVAKYDADNELVYLPAMARFQVGDEIPASNKNLIKGIIRELERFEAHAFGQDFVARYNEAFHLGKPLRSPLQAPSKGSIGGIEGTSKGSFESTGPLRDQDQDQEQEQETAKGDPGLGQASGPEVVEPGRVDPLTAYGLITVVTAAIRRNRSEIGVYNPGQWAHENAQRFLDRIPREQRTDATREDIRARAERFSVSTDARITKGNWNVGAFCENFVLLAAPARSAARSPPLPKLVATPRPKFIPPTESTLAEAHAPVPR